MVRRGPETGEIPGLSWRRECRFGVVKSIGAEQDGPGECLRVFTESRQGENVGRVVQ